MAPARVWAIAVALGLAAFGCAVLGTHLWRDHQNLHALINLVVQQQQPSPPDAAEDPDAANETGTDR